MLSTLSSVWLMALGFIVIYAIKSIIMVIPNSVLYVAAGVIFPTWGAILITYVGLTVSLSIGYITGQKLGETKVYDLLARKKNVNAFLNRNKEDLLSLCFLARLISLPFGLASLFFGALGTPFLKYVLMSLLGITPVMIPIIFSGAALTNPLSVAFLVPFGISFAITLVIFICYKIKFSKNVSDTI